ncbi:MAG: TonB C-terminal domain-containing protein, partial [Burkholderiales bacterium]|nr:TonB C-terminal domain-containing protein [Opitutaceae bacterium]
SWTPPAPAPAEVTPVEPVAAAPVQAVQKAEPVKTPPVVEPKPNFTQNIKSAIRKETRKAEREVKAQRAADAKAAAERTSYEQFQKQNASKTKSTSKTSSSGAANATPGPRIDASGIKKGVTGATGAGSAGAGGTALARAEANAMDAYFVMLRTRLLSSHELPGGVSDLLSAEVQFTIGSNGTVSGVRIVRSSGSKDFDQSVLEAFGRLKMPGRPDKKTDVQRLTFRIKEA